MRGVRLAFLALMAAMVIAPGGVSLAFHTGGVAECGGCHSMHGAPAGGDDLLIALDASATCLDCHEGSNSYHIATPDADLLVGPPKNLTPGGDFAWLKRTYTWTSWSTSTEEGDTHGHNIVASGTGYAADAHNAYAPGSDYKVDASTLSCTSCHDPHGKYRRKEDNSYVTGGCVTTGSGSYPTSNDPDDANNYCVGSYRLLAGNGYDTDTGAAFAVDPPYAVAPSSYNRSEATTQTRVAYGKGMSEWCATCHADMHTSGNIHPVGATMDDVKSTYEDYIGSGNLTGVAASSYLSLVPFEENSIDYTDPTSGLKAHAVSDDSYLNGPRNNSLVMCLSCHRAHASGFEYALRWNQESEFIVYADEWPGTDTTPTKPQYSRGRTSAEMRQAYYDRDDEVFSDYQRVLCNKCHGQD